MTPLSKAMFSMPDACDGLSGLSRNLLFEKLIVDMAFRNLDWSMSLPNEDLLDGQRLASNLKRSVWRTVQEENSLNAAKVRLVTSF